MMESRGAHARPSPLASRWEMRSALPPQPGWRRVRGVQIGNKLIRIKDKRQSSVRRCSSGVPRPPVRTLTAECKQSLADVLSALGFMVFKIIEIFLLAKLCPESFFCNDKF